MNDYLNTNGGSCGFQEDFLYADELADVLGRSRLYVYAMKAAGFQMPAGLATHIDALIWLAHHPDFTSAGYYNKGGAA